MNPAQLLAAASYMTDITPECCLYHSWRVALLGQYLASIIAPETRRDVFYAGLLQEIGSIGAMEHITCYNNLDLQVNDPYIKAHPERGAAILDWLPGMGGASSLVKSHHEWWNGAGFPEGLLGDEIPLGSQILRLADAADMEGCFQSRTSVSKGLHNLARFTGSAWSNDLWTALVGSIKDVEFYKPFLDKKSLPNLMKSVCEEIGVPDELNNDEGVERILHVVAAMVDLKDPATRGHSIRTAQCAKSLARHMCLSDEDSHMAYRAGLVHDCGRLGLPSFLVNRTGRLSDKELAIVRAHAGMTIRAFNCLPDCPEMASLGEIAGHDHERYDGEGYPDGLVGDRIPLISRILSVVDAFDAMRSTRSDRMVSSKAAVIRLQQNAGKQFDPQVIEAMVDLASLGGLGEELAKAA